MAKYRIIERTHPFQSYTRPFCVQKRFLGFLWWYDPLDDGMYSDGKSGDDEMVAYSFKYTGDKYMLNDLANNHKPTKVRITVEILDD